MIIPRPFVIDFETHPIGQRPGYPPEPVGVAIKRPVSDGWSSKYLAWGHPEGNNCDRGHATDVLRDIFQSDAPLLFHNAKFDIAVAHERLLLPLPAWSRVHDTTFLAFLADPHGRQHGLKELAEKLLSWPPEERDAVAIWIFENRDMLTARYGGKINGAKTESGERRATKAYEWYWACPGPLVGRYAIGDVDRTLALFEHLLPLVDAEMGLQAYDRERELLPILMENERAGMRVDMPSLTADIPLYRAAFAEVEERLMARLGVAGLNFDADQQTASALIAAGIVAEDAFPRTAPTKAHPEGQYSVSKENLKPEMFSDPDVCHVLGYRNRLATCLKMFMEPWEEQARVNGGYITTNWNQTAGEGGGTRTGRPSTSKHNFLNIAKDFTSKKDGYIHPEFLGLPDLPLCRNYITADEGQEWCHRDFSGQEMRVYAHYECGELTAAYIENPNLDPHAWLDLIIIDRFGRELGRTRVKNVNFARLYGGGLNAIQWQARCKSRAEAQEIADVHDEALPGRKLLDERIQYWGFRDIPIFTWGGRALYPEPPYFGQRKDYKTINYLVQGGAADITKQCIIDWSKAKFYKETRFLVTVYDEINISADRGKRATREMALLKEVMNADRLDVPMRSDGKRGFEWGKLEKCE